MALEDIERANLMASSESSKTLENMAESLDVTDSSEFAYDDEFLSTRTNLVGLNTDEGSVNEVIKGISIYTNSVNDIIRKLDSFISASEGLGSTVNAKAQEFISIMKESCSSIVNQLNKLSVDVKTVAENKGKIVFDSESKTSSSLNSVSSSNYIFDGGDE